MLCARFQCIKTMLQRILGLQKTAAIVIPMWCQELSACLRRVVFLDVLCVAVFRIDAWILQVLQEHVLAQWSAEIVALVIVASVVAEVIALEVGFNAFGDDVHIQIAA